MRAWSLTRRRFAGLLPPLLSLLLAPRLGAQEAPADRGIGGTGVTPQGEQTDQGIGGTGVVGTIRRFGSIVVNDLRIGYGRDVRVTIDGRSAGTGDLRLGQVVRAAALIRDERLVTRAIAITSEVTGPLERQRGERLTILGQTIDLGALPHQPSWRRGERLRVSGLRRPDGVIVASLVEPARERIDRVAGVLTASADGTLRIGPLALRNVDPALVGERIVVRGQARAGTLIAARAEGEAAILQALMPSRLSLEVFLQRRGDRLHLGSGLEVDDAEAVAALAEDEVVRAVVSASLQGGRVVVERVERLDRPGRAAAPARGGAAAPSGGLSGMALNPGDPHGPQGSFRGPGGLSGMGGGGMNGPGGPGPGGPGGIPH